MNRVHNVHERQFCASPQEVGALLDGLASAADRLWPSARWPRMRLDRPLQAGAAGGHGPIRYHVETYAPGSVVRFRLSAPRGFDGFHAFEILPTSNGGAILRHVLEMSARGPAMVTWPLIFRPLHDALVEDSLDTAARALGESVPVREWPLRVRLLRACVRLARYPL